MVTKITRLNVEVFVIMFKRKQMRAIPANSRLSETFQHTSLYGRTRAKNSNKVKINMKVKTKEQFSNGALLQPKKLSRSTIRKIK